MRVTSPRRAADRPTLLSCERGAAFVEVLVMVPLLVLLWTILVFLESGNTVDNEVMEDSRYCAWRHAVDECEGGAPRGCSLSGAANLSGAELDAVSGGALTDLTARLRFLAGEWQRPHGAFFTATKRDTLSRPLGWGAVSVVSRHTWMCQTPKGVWRDYSVFAALCQEKGLPWCGMFSAPTLPASSSGQVGAAPSSSAVVPARSADSRARLQSWRASRAGGDPI